MAHSNTERWMPFLEERGIHQFDALKIETMMEWIHDGHSWRWPNTTGRTYAARIREQPWVFIAFADAVKSVTAWKLRRRC